MTIWNILTNSQENGQKPIAAELRDGVIIAECERKISTIKAAEVT